MMKVYDEKEQLKEILNKLPKPRTELRPSSQPNGSLNNLNFSVF